MTKPLITAERLRELCRYDPKTGFFWRYPTEKQNIFQSPACRLIGSINAVTGYVFVGIDKGHYYGHRLAWLYMTGEWPDCEIDHINGCQSDNRFDNLRDVSASTNQENKRFAQSDNKCGFLGVHWNRQAKRWQSEIKIRGKKKYLGRFDTPELAHAAYISAKRSLHAGCAI